MIASADFKFMVLSLSRIPIVLLAAALTLAAAPAFPAPPKSRGEARDTLHIEARYPRETIDELERRGHTVDRWGDWNELAGHANGITIEPRSGTLAGGADPRSDGAASGY